MTPGSTWTQTGTNGSKTGAKRSGNCSPAAKGQCECHARKKTKNPLVLREGLTMKMVPAAIKPISTRKRTRSHLRFTEGPSPGIQTLAFRYQTRITKFGECSTKVERVATLNRPVIDRGLFRSTKTHGQGGADRGDQLPSGEYTCPQASPPENPFGRSQTPQSRGLRQPVIKLKPNNSFICSNIRSAFLVSYLFTLRA